MDNSLAYAQQLDRDDQLREFRQQFIIPEENGVEQIYFLGNSLGLQPRRTAGYIDQVLKQWARYGVESFFLGDDPWMHYHDHLVAPLANIVGAKPAEIVVMNQLTVNLHLMMVSFYHPAGKRRKIICEAKAFPSDQYMFETHLKHLGLDPAVVLIEIAPREGEHTIRLDDILHTIAATGEELALVLWGGLNYYTGQVFDMAAITHAAHKAGAKCGFDLAHAAGNVALHLHNWNVDFACWCSYKYLNAGPGAIGAAYIHERYHTDPGIQRLAGWWGYEKETRFAMQKGFRPIASAEGWQLSTPSPILYAAHRASLEIFAAAGFDRLREKGRLLSAYMLYLLDEINARASSPILEIITPRIDHERGCQVSMLMHQKGREVFDALGKAGIFADWREPNVIRVAAVPLYNRFEEVWRFADSVRRIIFAV
ncbi:kynureninase [Flavihumibacter fluvii]|uniref:kynureninase n=1 Tax=Flavihumibacter fluvii TaxID=2838157 RepID=UPI001BDE6425|nr:kynureninase [Flavihumibacter fluvii]ULQ52957.1 kynureninase [Flavihumibacter fluvii]